MFSVVGNNATVAYSEWKNFQVCAGSGANFYGYEDEARDLIINTTEQVTPCSQPCIV